MATNPTTPSGTRLSEFLTSDNKPDTAAIANTFSAAAKQTAQVTGPTTLPSIGQTAVGHVTQPIGKATNSGQASTNQAAQESFAGQVSATQKQANQASEALKLQGATTVSALTNAGSSRGRVDKAAQQAATQFAQALAVADEYVSSVTADTTRIMNRLTDIANQAKNELDTGRANDMQVAAQSVRGSLKDAEKQVLEAYGSDSMEYQVFQGKKLQTLANTSSQVLSAYSQQRNAFNQAWLNTASQAETGLEQFKSYAYNTRATTYLSSAQAEATYGLQVEGMRTALDQLETSILNEAVSALRDSPVFTTDSLPLVEQLLASEAANKLNSPTNTVNVITPPSWSQGLQPDQALRAGQGVA